MLRQHFPEFRFGSPAPEALIRKAELALRVRLPEQLRALYMEADGFREHIGNAKYLLSLLDDDKIGSLVAVTKSHWGGIFGFSSRKFRPFVFFGISASNYAWGIKISGPSQIIRYRYDMGGEYEVVGEDILEIYDQDLACYAREI